MLVYVSSHRARRAALFALPVHVFSYFRKVCRRSTHLAVRRLLLDFVSSMILSVIRFFTSSNVITHKSVLYNMLWTQILENYRAISAASPLDFTAPSCYSNTVHFDFFQFMSSLKSDNHTVVVKIFNFLNFRFGTAVNSIFLCA